VEEVRIRVAELRQICRKLLEAGKKKKGSQRRIEEEGRKSRKGDSVKLRRAKGERDRKVPVSPDEVVEKGRRKRE
jgi:hypothetical protein